MSSSLLRRYRPDIDGLRAVAVLAVIVFHFNSSWLPGGFVGVDIFFVISGYLITGNILNDNASEKGFSWKEFYRKRALRILPVLFFVVFVTFFVGNFILLPQDSLDLTYSSLAAVFSSANIYFTYFLDVSYFADDSSHKPLLHLWSLGVEEQFYFIWPLILVFFITKVNRVSSYVGFLAIIVSSFVMAEIMLQVNPMFSYYMLPTRAGELLIGGVFSYVVFNHNVGRFLGSAASNFLSLVGALLIIYSMVFLDSSKNFPGINALLPTLGAGLVILSGASNKIVIVNKLLSFRYVVLIGLISYSLYLWHWPVLAYYRYIFGSVDGWIQLLLIFIIVMLSIISYFFVEKPTRKLKMSFKKVMFRGVGAPAFAFSCLAVVVILTKGFGTYYFDNNYKATIEQLKPDSPAYAYNYICQSVLLDEDYLSRRECIINSDVEPTVLLWGDSNAAHYVGVIGAIAKEVDFSFRNIAHSSCPPLLNGAGKYIHGDALSKRSCKESIELVKKNLGKYEVIIIAAAWDTYFSNNQDLMSDLNDTILFLEKEGKKIIVVGNVPIFANVDKSCKQKSIKISSVECEGDKPVYTKSIANPAIEKLVSTYVTVNYFDIWEYLCEGELCFNSLDNRLIYFDGWHLSMSGSWYLGEYIVNDFSIPDAFKWLGRKTQPLSNDM
ncbi:acyltransferase family protein [Oceanisphaera sp. IT1-181]|uniref:acyltransferase family protein n=1 Tax=Oceanisphaera sp. IT1-181 TaxID=3081199 RepID=UPI0029CA5900|nr:acyltransferase family protein [Oceanisphaera sp. IT1-181]